MCSSLSRRRFVPIVFQNVERGGAALPFWQWSRTLWRGGIAADRLALRCKSGPRFREVFGEPRRVSIVGGVLLALTLSFIVACLMTPATLEPVESADAACSDPQTTCSYEGRASRIGSPPSWLSAETDLAVPPRNQRPHDAVLAGGSALAPTESDVGGAPVESGQIAQLGYGWDRAG